MGAINVSSGVFLARTPRRARPITANYPEQRYVDHRPAHVVQERRSPIADAGAKRATAAQERRNQLGVG
jgi:hypothetical protein